MSVNESRRDHAPAAAPNLLVPEFDHSKHQLYVDQLKALIDGQRARNIAVAGQYSTGKSSVLDGLTKDLADTKLRPITLSLSTIDADAARLRVGSETEDAGTKAGIPAITSLIQNEIVKQLVYRQRPSKVPDSRFRRTEAFSPARSAGWAVVAAAVAFIVVKVLPSVGETARGVIAAAAAAIVVFLFQWRLRGRISLQQLTAGPATLSLDTSKSYFDEYLDELIYFFDVSRCRIVIFEDIDRFDDPHIFETLRELNTLLNSAEQLAHRRHGPIRFIYATRDSIFEINNEGSPDTTPGGPGSPAADRTKFFDAVVPLVPFVTHRTSRDHFTRLLTGIGISPRVLGIVAKYVTDMRLIVNICNELEVFKAIVLREGGLRHLSADNLFAMVVYKNLYPGDFEKITSGQSRLDRVRDLYRRAVNDTAAYAERRLVELRTGPAQSRSVEEHLAAACTRLRDTVDDVIASHGGTGNPRALPTLLVDGAQYSLDQLAQREFWEAAGPSTGQVSIQIPNRHAVPLSREAIERAFGLALPDTTVAEVLSPDVKAEIDGLERDHKTILEAGIADLFTREDLTLDGEPISFVERVKALVGSPVAVELLEAGFLDEHFAFYVADYPADTMSPEAAEFEMTVIERFGSDHRFSLPQVGTDVPALLESVGDAFLGDRRGYNVDIVDHLLEEDSDYLDGMTTSLARGAPGDVTFVDAYLASGKHQRSFLRALANKWELIFYYLAHRTEGEVETEREWIDAAIRGAVTDIAYRSSPVATERLEAHAAQMPAFTDSGAADAPVVVHVVSQLRAALPDITRVTPAVRWAIIGAGLYQVNQANLKDLAPASSGEVPALDELTSAERGEVIVDHVLEHLLDYVLLVKDSPTAQGVSDPDRYPEIVTRLGESRGFAELEDADAGLLLSRAPSGAVVTNLPDVPAKAWPALVRAHRCLPSAASLAAYVAEYADLGEWPSLLGNADALTTNQDDAQDIRQQAAIAVLAMESLDPGRRVRLLEGLDLESYIPVEDLPAAAIALLPDLTHAHITEDSAEALNSIPADQAEVRRRFIATSTKLGEYIDAIALSDADVSAVIDSDNQAAISNVLQRSDLLQEARDATIAQAVEKAITSPDALTTETLLALARGTKSASRFAALLTKHLDGVNDAELRQLLAAMPAPYDGLGLSEVEIPDADRALADALEARGLASRVHKARNRPFVRVTP